MITKYKSGGKFYGRVGCNEGDVDWDDVEIDCIDVYIDWFDVDIEHNI